LLTKFNLDHKLRITVVIDGKDAGNAVSDTFRSGPAGLECGWEEVKFDNLSVEAAG